MEIKKIKAEIGSQTLVAIKKQKQGEPVSYGNCFDFSKTNYKCVNMYAENASYAFKNFLDDGMVEIVLFDNRYAEVIDKRIPTEWLTKNLCNCCVSPEVMIQIVDYRGTKNKEITYDGGDGTSEDNAVIIKGLKYSFEIDIAIYGYEKEKHPSWKPIYYSIGEYREDGRYIRTSHYETPDGRKSICFDVTELTGKRFLPDYSIKTGWTVVEEKGVVAIYE